MTVFTVHRRGAAVRLVPDRFSWSGLVFGPLALAARGAWLAALALLAAWIVAVGLHARFLFLVLPVAAALFGSDLRRWELGLGGWRADGLAVGRGRDDARLRLDGRAGA